MLWAIGRLETVSPTTRRHPLLATRCEALLTTGIQGDGNADGFLTATFSDLAPGDYSISIGGANYAAQLLETGPTFPTYGVNVSVQAVPEPSTWAMIVLASGLGLWIMCRRKSA